jgi:hypothetical protein
MNLKATSCARESDLPTIDEYLVSCVNTACSSLQLDQSTIQRCRLIQVKTACIVSPYATYGARRAVGTHYGQTRIHWADYSLRHRRDRGAGTTMLYHLRIYLRAHSLSVMTTGRRSCWSMGTAAASAGAAGPSEGLRARRSSGWTKSEYTATRGRHYHATFGSGPMRQCDDRDSEPDYLLRPTGHGPGGTLLDYHI